MKLAETVKVVEIEPRLSAVPIPTVRVATPFVDAPDALVEYVQPDSVVELVAPAPAPAPAATYAAPAPVAGLVAPAR